jgi:hypothetical protein
MALIALLMALMALLMAPVAGLMVVIECLIVIECYVWQHLPMKSSYCVIAKIDGCI